MSFGASILVRSDSDFARLLRRKTLRRNRGEVRDSLPPGLALHRRACPPQKVLASAVDQAPDEAAAPVQKDEIVKGYEYAKGQYVMIEPSEIAQLRVPSKHTVEIQQFVSLDELPPEFLEKPYFIVPDNDTQAEAFAVVRAALAKSKKAGLGKIAFGGREHILAITAAPGSDRGMMAYTMRYQEELRKPPSTSARSSTPKSRGLA